MRVWPVAFECAMAGAAFPEDVPWPGAASGLAEAAKGPGVEGPPLPADREIDTELVEDMAPLTVRFTPPAVVEGLTEGAAPEPGVTETLLILS